MINYDNNIRDFNTLKYVGDGQKLVLDEGKRLNIANVTFFEKFAKVISLGFTGKTDVKLILDKIVSLNNGTTKDIEALKSKLNETLTPEDLQSLFSKLTQIERDFKESGIGLEKLVSTYKEEEVFIQEKNKHEEKLKELHAIRFEVAKKIMNSLSIPALDQSLKGGVFPSQKLSTQPVEIPNIGRVNVPNDVMKRLDAFHYYLGDQLVKSSDSEEKGSKAESLAAFFKKLPFTVTKELAEKILSAACIDALGDAAHFLYYDIDVQSTVFKQEAPFKFLVTEDQKLLIEGYLPYSLKPIDDVLDACLLEKPKDVLRFGCFKQVTIIDLTGKEETRVEVKGVGLAKEIGILYKTLAKIPGDVPLSDESSEKLFSSFEKLETSVLEETIQQSYLDWISQAVKPFFKVPINKIRSYFIDYQHPWKQQRYKVCLDEMRHFFPNYGLENAKKDFENGTDLQKLTFILLKVLTEDYKGNYRRQMFDFMTTLRATLSSDDFEQELKKDPVVRDPAVDLLLIMCRVRMTEVHPYSFLDYLVSIMIQTGAEKGEGLKSALDKEGISREDFAAIEMAPIEMKAKRAAVELGKLFGTTGVNFDPHISTNTPYVIGDLVVSKKPVRLLRMGTPTMESWKREIRIIPEFEYYLEALQRTNECHLYVSLQNNHLGWVERRRNDEIKKLQAKYPGTFHFIVLDQDSDFYKRAGRFDQSEVTANQFKEDFLNQLKGENTGFYFSEELKKELPFEEILETVHKALFNENEVLSLKDCQDFIELAYPFIEVAAMSYTKADVANITCKDAIDRAAKNNAILLSLATLLQGNWENEERQRELRVFTHAPALLVKKQAIIESRKERLLSALEVLKKEEVQKRLLQNRGILGIDPNSSVKIEKKENQLPGLT